MTTRAELRADLRIRLEDPGPVQLWSDAVLNDAIADAIRRYGISVPMDATAAVPVEAGARRIAVTPGSVNPARIVRVRDPDGITVLPWREDDAPGDRAQGWRWWDDGIDLAMPAAAGTWSIDHRAGRLPPEDDTAEAAILPGDEPGIVSFAASMIFGRRAAEEAKRGAVSVAHMLWAMANDARMDGAAVLRRRRARGGG